MLRIMRSLVLGTSFREFAPAGGRLLVVRMARSVEVLCSRTSRRMLRADSGVVAIIPLPNPAPVADALTAKPVLHRVHGYEKVHN